MEKTTIFQTRSLGARLTIVMEHLPYRTLILSEELQFYFLFRRS